MIRSFVVERMHDTRARFALAILVLVASGCTTQVRMAPLVDGLVPRPPDAPIAWITDEVELPPHEEVARISVHIESTFFVRASEEQALEKVREEARRAGADAVVDVRFKRSTILETQALHATATAIRFRR